MVKICEKILRSKKLKQKINFANNERKKNNNIKQRLQ